MANYNPPEWINGQGPDAGIVISSRARLARCLVGFPFPSLASPTELAQVSEIVCSAAGALRLEFPGLKEVKVDDLSTEDKNTLVNTHTVSPEFVIAGPGRTVLLDSGGKLSIMINEEDHLRIQVMSSGLDVSSIWGTIDRIDDILASNLPYGFSSKLGFLTCSVSNIGTGLRLSVMMHLAGLKKLGLLSRHIKAANALGVSVRGMHGEGTRPLGDLFQVSNEHTLGMAEVELVDKVNAAAEYLLTEECTARKEILEDSSNTLVDILGVALGKLKYSQHLSAEKALEMLSTVRLAYESGLVDNCSRSLLNYTMTKMMSMYGNDFSAGTMRAGVLRESLKNAAVRDASE